MATQKIFTKIGDLFGNYTIISDPYYDIVKDKKVKKIKVRCKCGHERDIHFTRLKQLNGCKLCFGAKNHKFKSGEIIDNFTIVKYVFIPELHKSKIKIRCKCGKECLIKPSNLNNKVCTKCNPRKFSIENHSYLGTKNIPKTYFTSVKSSAKSKNRDFSIDIEYLEEIFVKQNKKCIYSGLSISLNGKGRESTASLDRIDSSKGYIKGNVQWVHKTINKMKLDLTEKEFLFFINQIYNYRENKNALE